jgi:hypothetical protein
MSWEDIGKEATAVSRRQPITLEDIPAIIDICRLNLQNVEIRDDRILACCPFHNGDPKHQSFWVNLTQKPNKVGIYSCLNGKCRATGGFQKLADHLNVTLEQRRSDYTFLPEIKVADVYHKPLNLKELPPTWNWKRHDCTISHKALRIIGAKWYSEDVGDHMDRRLWLPVESGGGIVGHVGALISKRYEGCRKYKNSDGLDAKGLYVFLPQVLRHTHSRTLVLVEGPADALRLIDNDIAAIPLLGLYAWTRAKTEYLNLAFDHVVVMMDNDEAGQNAKEAIRAMFVADLKPTFIGFPKGCKDAAEMSAGAITNLKRYIERIEK